MPFFSVVIASYNHGQYIEYAIRSIINQSCQDFELIIVDGDSADNSLDIIKKYADRLAWWVSEPDMGQSDAINKGFAKAKGKYFLWLNADDVMLPVTLEAAISYLQKKPSCSWLTGDTVYFNEYGIISRCIYGPYWNNWLMKRTLVCNMINGPSSIFHRSIYEKARGLDPSLKYAMDMDLWMKFVDIGIRFHRIHRYIWGFRIHQGSKTSHSIGNVKNEEFKREVNEVISRNKRIRTQAEFLLLKVFKVVSGVYFRTLYDSWRWRGLPIDRMIEKGQYKK
jgi:glycosyltransferase involved in cell wall biosynthesis